MPPNSWSTVGGTGSALYDVPGKLFIVSQTEPVHEQIAAWLERFRQARRRAALQLPYDPIAAVTPALRPTGARTKADVLTKLQQPVSVDLAGVALDKAITYLERRWDVSLIVDRLALEEEGVRQDTPVTLHANQVPMKAALKTLLRDLGLTYLVGDGHVLITGPLEVENRLEFEFYPIGELARSPDQVDTVADLIERTIRRESWSNLGGSGDIRVDRRGRVLLISHTQAVHEEIADLLAQLQRKGR